MVSLFIVHQRLVWPLAVSMSMRKWPPLGQVLKCPVCNAQHSSLYLCCHSRTVEWLSSLYTSTHVNIHRTNYIQSSEWNAYCCGCLDPPILDSSSQQLREIVDCRPDTGPSLFKLSSQVAI